LFNLCISWEIFKKMIKENAHDVVNGINSFEDSIDVIQINHNFFISKTKFIHLPFNHPYIFYNVFLIINHLTHQQHTPNDVFE